LSSQATARIKLADNMQFLFSPMRYKVAHGGRGGCKSWSFARALLIKTLQKKLRILCTRELQNSIEDSVYRLLCDQVELLGLSAYFIIKKHSITSLNGSEFIFEGIRFNVNKIRSMEGIDICWVEEAEKVSEGSWEILIPTIRKDGSEIWVSFNPDEEGDPTYRRFIKSPPPDCAVVETTWRDNPWLPDALKREKDYLAAVDTDAYAHVWEGGCRHNSNAQVLHGKCFIESFEPGPDWNGPYFGGDWGFAQDPTTLVKCWIHDLELFIEYEVYGIGVEINDTPELFDHIPDARKYVVRADCARPETISYLQKHGYGKCVACKKWKGSVEDGIAHLRSFKRIVIHPRCIHTVQEARLWSFKRDRLTNDILPELIDENNHIWDAVRYALEPLISTIGTTGMLDYMAAQAGKLKEMQDESRAN